MTDLVVGATLLVALISFVAPLAVRTGRLWQDTDRTRLALDELSNQLERITRLEESELPAALESLTPSPHLAKRLPSATIEGETITDTDGTRVVLSLHWDRVGLAKPITLVGWVDSLPVEVDLEKDAPDGSSAAGIPTEEKAEETTP